MDPTFPIRDRLSDDPQQRTLELIYALRRYFYLARDKEWTVVVRELILLGGAAVPELVGELDRTDEINHLQTLGFILCQINDPRSVPALIRCLTRPRRQRKQAQEASGWKWVDPFLDSDEWWHSPRLAAPGVCGGPRPPEIIQAALERITGHDSPTHTGSIRMGWQGSDGRFHELPSMNGDLLRVGWCNVRGSFMGLPDDPDLVRRLFEERQRYWRTWWREHGAEFLPEDQLARWDQPAPLLSVTDGMDPIVRAGTARLGAMFPTGPDARLGAIHEIDFDRYIDSPVAVDFDRQRMYLRWQTGDAIHAGGSRQLKAMTRLGIDLTEDGTTDALRTWRVDNSVWHVLEERIRDPHPLEMGIEDGCQNIDSALHGADERVTHLFITPEGGSGILQVEPPQRPWFGRVWRYRMWIKDIQPRDIPAPALAGPSAEHLSQRWDEPRSVTLAAAKPGADCMYSIAHNRKYSLPADEPWTSPFASVDPEDPMFCYHWKAGLTSAPPEAVRAFEEVDIMAIKAPVAGGESETRSSAGLQLVIYNTECRGSELNHGTGFRPERFDDMSVATAMSYLDRGSQAGEPQSPGSISCYSIHDGPVTTLFKLRGRMVLLQIQQLDVEDETISFRFKQIEARTQ